MLEVISVLHINKNKFRCEILVMNDDSKIKLVVYSLCIGGFIGVMSMYIFDSTAHNDSIQNYTSENNKEIIKLENKITKLESYIQSRDVLSNNVDEFNNISIDADVDGTTIDQISDSLSDKLRTDLEEQKINEAIELKQEQIIVQQETQNKDELLRESVIAAIQPDSLNRMSNIREVMESEQMMTMSKEGRETVVKELVHMANSGELDIATFFNN